MSMYLIDGAILENIAEEIRKIKGNPGVETITPEEIIEELKIIRYCVGQCYLEVVSNPLSELNVAVPTWKNCLFRAKLNDEDGRVAYSDAVMLTVTGHIAITKQPVDVVAAIARTVVFTVEATGIASYQWEFNNRVDGWQSSSASGNKTNTLTTEANANRYNYLYRCKLTDNNGNVCYTDSVRMLNPAVLAITKQPVDVFAAVDDTVTFSVEAVGEGLSYQWQRMFSYESDWKNVNDSTASTANLVFSMAEYLHEAIYRCIISDADGNSIITNEVKTYVKSAVTITEQPQSYESKSDDGYNTFRVRAANCVLFDWQYSRDNGKTWQNIISSSDDVNINGCRLCDLAWHISTLKG